MAKLPVSRTASWQVCHVIEMAADLAEVAVPWAESGTAVADAHLFEFWGHGRQLTTEWLRKIEHFQQSRKRRVTVSDQLALDPLANEVFSIEVAARLLATVLAALDRVRSTPEYKPIAENTLFAIQHVRTRLLALILTGDDQHAAGDRFRRRCERWTDLLIGPLLVRFATAVFTHDSRRSWEFGEDLLADAGLDVARQLVRPSLLSAFRGPAGRSPIASPSAHGFFQSMVAMVPAEVMTRQLGRWRGALPAETSAILPSSRTAIDDVHEPEGWSLLDRCLRIAEQRRSGQD